MNTESDCIWTPPISNEKIIGYNSARYSNYNMPRAFMNPPLADKVGTQFGTPILLMTMDIEEKMANNWNNELHNIKTYETLEYFVRRYPARPWLLGISYNINAESELKNLNYYNHRDCIQEEESILLDRLSLDASIKIMNKSTPKYNIYPTETKKWFDNNTRVKTMWQ
jgi:hypothetical protein